MKEISGCGAKLKKLQSDALKTSINCIIDCDIMKRKLKHVFQDCTNTETEDQESIRKMG